MSVYQKNEVIEVETSRTLSLVVDNQPGTLARVIGLFSGRGYNIESLTVTEIDKIRNLSRISLVTRGTSMTIEQYPGMTEIELKKLSQNFFTHCYVIWIFS